MQRETAREKQEDWKASLVFQGHLRASQVTVLKNPSAMQETQVRSLGWEDPLEKGMATHCSVLAGIIPWTEWPGGTIPWTEDPSAWGRKESDTTECTRTRMHEGHLSCLSTTALDPSVLGAGIPGHPPPLRELKNFLFPATLVTKCPVQSKAVWK